MTDLIAAIFHALVLIVFAFVIWGLSASYIGTECQKLGGFFVGDTVYKCEVHAA